MPNQRGEGLQGMSKQRKNTVKNDVGVPLKANAGANTNWIFKLRGRMLTYYPYNSTYFGVVFLESWTFPQVRHTHLCKTQN